MALLIGQLTGASSLRGLVEQLDAQSHKGYHLGLKSVRRSTLAEANQKRSTAVYYDVFYRLLARLSRQKELREVMGQVQLIDSTTISLCKSQYQWANFREHKSGIKIHTLYDPNAVTPIYFEMTKAKVHDGKAVANIPVFKGVTYVFDRAYNGGEWLKKLMDEDCFFVGRMKLGTTYEVIETREAAGQNVISDELIHIKNRTNDRLKNRLLRRIVFHRESDQKELVFFTSDLKRTALEVADLYKQRWQIELFFKWIKQNLKIKRFYGTSENAVKLQILVAMISYVLLRLIQQSLCPDKSLIQVSTRIKSLILEKMPLLEVFRKPPDLPDDFLQLRLI